jgi:hypothetical protein
MINRGLRSCGNGSVAVDVGPWRRSDAPTSAERLFCSALAADAQKRGWIADAERHRRLVAQLDTLISEAQAG